SIAMRSSVIHCCLSILVRFLASSVFFFFSSRRRHTRSTRDWSSDVCSSDLTITVNAVNDAPAFDAVGNQTANEDSGAHDVSITRSEERRVGKEWRYRWWPNA